MYKNPVLLCDYSDPDVIKTDSEFYMVASSFNFTPGLPVLSSKNLIDWELKNYIIEKIPDSKYEYPLNARGIWAPSFSFNNGIYYVVVGMPDEGLYVAETSEITGRWSPLRQIWQGKGFIDPYLFWDDDGKAYIIHAYAKSRIGFNSKLGIMDFDPVSLKCSSPDEIIFDGTETQPIIEGPKVYKRNGFYYIFAPAGGVTDGWQTVLRSKNIKGPYEERIVLKEGKSGINGPHQGALVTDFGGNDWFIHFQERGIYGRISHLEPVIWKNDWPYMGTAVKTGEECGEPVLKYRSPVGGKNEKPRGYIARKYSAFENAELDWQWSGNFDETFAIGISKSKNNIESFYLNFKNVTNKNFTKFPVLWNSSNILTQKIKYEGFVFSTKIETENMPEGTRAGVVFMGEDYSSVCIERTETGYDFVHFESSNTKMTDDEREEVEIERISLPDYFWGRAFNVKMEFIPLSVYSGCIQYTVRIGGLFKKFQWQSDYFNTEQAHWVGGRFGVYAQGDVDGKILFYDVKLRH